ncbi:MAG: hypothetical protein SOR68_02735 [Campylobacter hyointestinalis]|nr:hypothetical protein [Campylobacter hyointestinalis]
MKILSALSSIFIELISYVPTALGVKLRYHIYKYLFKKTDGFFSIGFGCTITGFRHISLGKNVSISKNSFLYASYGHEVGGVTIGDNFFMGTNSALCGNRGNITIGNNVMIASNCVILKDVVLKKEV